ncbi:hypothetical protein GCM10027034_31600 [Ramlibacter solisilvae]
MSKSSALDPFLAKYDEGIATQTRAVREHLVKLFPRGYELVYDNYNALAFGFSPTDRASDVVVSVAAYPKWVTLFFLHGASLPDPHRVLQGTGSRVRSVRLAPASVLHSAPVQELLRLVVADARSAFALAPTLSSVVKSVSAKQRPRKPSAAKARSSSVPKRAKRSGA